MIHAATEYELSRLNILIRQLKSLKRVRAGRERGKVLNIDMLPIRKRMCELHSVLFILVLAKLQGSVWATQEHQPDQPPAADQYTAAVPPKSPGGAVPVLETELPGSRLAFESSNLQMPISADDGQ